MRGKHKSKKAANTEKEKGEAETGRRREAEDSDSPSSATLTLMLSIQLVLIKCIFELILLWYRDWLPFKSTQSSVRTCFLLLTLSTKMHPLLSELRQGSDLLMITNVASAHFLLEIERFGPHVTLACQLSIALANAHL